MTRAISAQGAAVTAARRLGVDVADPMTLSDSNNLVLWLRPAPVVAKVATGHHQRLQLELSVACHLLDQSGPAVRPAPGLPQVVHRSAGFEMTFWCYEPAGGSEPSSEATASALFELHRALGTYSRPLPSYEEELAAVSGVLSDTRRAAALPDRGRRALRRTLSELTEELRQLAPPSRAIHGSPHGGNQIARSGTIRFIDFETACRGPVEWDLAHVDEDVARDYQGELDPRVLDLCRGLVSAKTATWCWDRHDHPDLRWHAEHHLQVVEDLFGFGG